MLAGAGSGFAGAAAFCAGAGVDADAIPVFVGAALPCFTLQARGCCVDLRGCCKVLRFAGSAMTAGAATICKESFKDGAGRFPSGVLSSRANSARLFRGVGIAVCLHRFLLKLKLLKLKLICTLCPNAALDMAALQVTRFRASHKRLHCPATEELPAAMPVPVKQKALFSQMFANCSKTTKVLFPRVTRCDD